MPATRTHPFVARALRRLASESTADADLLGRFAEVHDEAAFATLVDRHGPLVLGVCRRMLGNTADADDAFQAVFFALARNPTAVRNRSALAGWLYGAAYRVSLQIRRRHARARAIARVVDRPAARDPFAAMSAREFMGILDEELVRLPERLRLPVVLCLVEGLTHEEAARRLGCSAGSVRGRLERGRQKLRRRLSARGVTPLVAGLGTAVIVPPAAFARALDAAGGRVVPPAVVELAGTLLRSGWGLMQAATALVLGIALAAAATGGPDPAPPKADPGEPAKPAAATAAVRTDLFGDPLPEGAVLRLGTIRHRHGHVIGIGFAADGKTFRTVSKDGSVRVWDAESGLRVGGRQSEYHEPVYGNYISPDGRVLVSRDDKRGVFTFEELETGRRLSEVKIPYHGKSMWSWGFSRDSQRFAAFELPEALGDTPKRGPGKLNVFDIQAGTVRSIAAPVNAGHLFEFTPDRWWVLLTTDPYNAPERITTCWDLEKGETAWTLDCSFGAYAFTPDRKMLVAYLRDKEGKWAFGSFDLATGKPVAGLKLPEVWDIDRMVFAPDGRTLFLYTPGNNRDGRQRIDWLAWDITAGKERYRIENAFGGLAFAPDGKTCVSAGDAIQKWDLATGQALYPDTRALGHRGPVETVAVSPDGRWAAGVEKTQELVAEIKYSAVQIWDLHTGRPVPMDYTGGQWLWSHNGCAFSPDGKRLVASGCPLQGSHEMVLFDTATGKSVRTIPRMSQEMKDAGVPFTTSETYTFSADGSELRALVRATPPGEKEESHQALVRWSVATGERLGIEVLPRRDLRYYLSPNPRTPTIAGWGELVDLATKKVYPLARERGLGPTKSHENMFSRDGRFLTSPTHAGFYDPGHDVRIWETATGKVAQTLPVNIGGLSAFAQDDRCVVVAGWNGIGLWERASKERLLWYPAPEPGRQARGESFARSLAVPADGRVALTGLPDATIVLWDLTGTGRRSAAEAPQATAAELARWWDALAGADAVAAHRAGWELSDRPAQALPLLRERLKPVTPPPAAETTAAIAGLDAPAFADREAAEKKLRSWSDAAVPALRAAAQGNLSAEQKQRITRLLAEVDVEVPAAGERLRGVRAVGVLARLKTPEAKRLLSELASGAEGARLTREATAALQRLDDGPSATR